MKQELMVGLGIAFGWVGWMVWWAIVNGGTW